MAIGSFTGDYDTKVAALARRRKMAELLQAEALKGYTPPPNGLAKTSIFQPLGQMAQAFASLQSNKGLDDEEAALSAARQKGMSEQLDKLANGTELTIPGTLPHLPGVAPMTQEGSPVVPPPEGEPDLRQMVKSNLEAQTEQPGAATTAFSPLNKRDTIAETVKLGDIMGGTAGATVSAKAVEAGIDPNKTSKATWVTGRDAKGQEVHGWADPARVNDPDHGFTPVGGAKPETSEGAKALRDKIAIIKKNTLDNNPGMDDLRAETIAVSLANDLIKSQVSPVSGRVVYSDLAGHTLDVTKGPIPTVGPASSTAEPKALAPVNLPGVPGAEPAAAAPQPKMMPNQVDPAKIPAKQSEAQILTEQLALEKGLLASGENGPDQQYIHERNIKAITERLTKIGAVPPETAPTTSTAVKPKLDLRDPAVIASYRQNPANEPYLPPPSDRNVTGSGTTKHTEALNAEMKEITKQRDVKKLAPLEAARASYEALLDKIAADPKSGVIRTVDPASGKVTYNGAAPGMQLDMLIPKWFQSQNAQDSAAAHKSLDNIFTQMRSGLAVTSQEMANKMKELGIDPFATPETFWGGYSRFSNLMDAENDAILGQFAPIVQDYWNANKPAIRAATPLPSAKTKTAASAEAKSNAKLEEDARKRANGYIVVK